MNGSRIRLALGAGVALIVLAAGAWLWATAGRESTDDAQVDAHVTPIAARVGGTIARTHVVENQAVEAGAALVELDPRDFEIALARARAELADAEAAAVAANVTVPITQATASSGVTTARESVEQAGAAIDEAQKTVDGATARLASAQARLREAEVHARNAAQDLERLRGLMAKDEISRQQFDAAAAAAESAHAATDSARSQVVEAEAGIRTAESRLRQARSGEQQARAEMTVTRTAPNQVAATRARAASAVARVQQARALVSQAELNLQYAVVHAPVKGIVSRKAAEPGQVVQPGQPLMTIVALDPVWVTANFKETQIEHMRSGQRVSLKVDTYGGHEFKGHVESISPATGSRFSLLPPNNATGNFVKVVQRVPVKIVIDEGQDADHVLRPGMSVEPTVYTN